MLTCLKLVIIVFISSQTVQTAQQKLGSDVLETTNKNTTERGATVAADRCVSAFYPCSNYILGNSVLIAYYGVTLGFGAKLISDGAEALLDLGVAPALIGGVILPVSGVVPDSMMIFVSGLGDKQTAQKQISVGMGTLAGSTVLLLTVAWGVSLIVGRVDLVEGPTCHGLVANSNNTCSGFKLKKQGVEVTREVTMTAVIMLVTTAPYFIIQSSDWYFGASRVGVKEPEYVRMAALVTMVIAFSGFTVYIAMQFIMAHRGADTGPMLKHKIHKQHEMMLKAARMFYLSAQVSKRRDPNEAFYGSCAHEMDHLVSEEHNQMLLSKKYFASWRLSAKESTTRRHIDTCDQNGCVVTESGPVFDQDQDQEDLIPTPPPAADSNYQDSPGVKWGVLGVAVGKLTLGVGLVTVFSDPMCDSLTRITDPTNPQFIPISSFYISFIITPLCSNASELVSSVTFAMKKEKENLVMTYTQLYSAAIMNNTMCLGVFCALVYFRELEWYFSAEVTSILFTEFLMAALAIGCRRVYRLYWAIPVILIYFLSLLLVLFLEKVLRWG